MNEKQIKRHFEDMGLKITDVAHQMQAAFPSITIGSADVMLRQLIAGQRWYPVYAQWLKDAFGIKVEKSSTILPVRERMRRAA